MSKNSLKAFVNRVLEESRLTGNDVRELSREVFPFGITCREEADILIALDRAVATADPAWSCYLVAALVEFAVWTSRPTGRIDQETARWLTSSLSAGTGPTETALRAAFEIVKEAHEADEALLAFLMRHGHRRCEAEPAAERLPNLAA